MRKEELCIILAIILILSICFMFKNNATMTCNRDAISNQSISSITQEQIKQNIKQQHPRLLATDDDFRSIKLKINTDSNVKLWFKQLKIKSDRYLSAPVNTYDTYDGLRSANQSKDRIVELSFMYRVTGNKKYAKRAWLELESICENYIDWNTKHLLDTATLAYSAGIGYDWLYDYLTPKQRLIVKNAIIEKALNKVLPMYKNKSHWFVSSEYNWNLVCNSGISISALSIIEDNEDIATEVLPYSLKSIKYGLKIFSIDGSSVEGPSYWAYGTKYLVYLLGSLDTSMNTTYNILDCDGLSNTSWFLAHITGKLGSFNYSDSENYIGEGKEVILWFADKFNKRELTWYHKYSYNKRQSISVYDILWYKSEIYNSTAPKELDKYYSKSEVITMRSDWESSLGTFVGFKGGLNGVPHGDLDSGTFVYDSFGVRWAHDLGRENYTLPGYFSFSENRSKYYRKRAEGHNTIVIDPNKAPDQNINCESSIVYNELNKANSATAIANLTPAYNKYANSIMRSVKLTNNRKELIIKDDIDLKSPQLVYWQMHTRANGQVTENGKAVLLKQNGKQLYIKLISNTNGRFEIIDAKPYDTSPNPPGQTPNTGFRKVVFKISNAYKESLSIVMIPMEESSVLPTISLDILNFVNVPPTHYINQ